MTGSKTVENATALAENQRKDALSAVWPNNCEQIAIAAMPPHACVAEKLGGDSRAIAAHATSTNAAQSVRLRHDCARSIQRTHVANQQEIARDGNRSGEGEPIAKNVVARNRRRRGRERDDES